ncbi:MAG: cobalamin-dependent protein, partial [Desulfobacteraceae bacterium]
MDSDFQFYTPKHPIRVITATSLFDGHDAAINIFRRILQSSGAEVIHLGHNRSVKEIVEAAIQEDAQAIAVSSYQGGHMEFFKYMFDCLNEAGADHIKIFGGGGGVIVPEEIAELEDYGIAKIYSPIDGTQMGLEGIIKHLIQQIDMPLVYDGNFDSKKFNIHNKVGLARLISVVEQYGQNENGPLSILDQVREKAAGNHAPTIGLTGTGGAGKSSLTDELILRLLHDFPKLTLAIVSCDPSR